MAKENLYLELATNLAVNQFNLDEMEWEISSFNDGSKTVTVGLVKDDGTKLRVSYDRDIVRYEEMKTWSLERKIGYVAMMQENDRPIPDELLDSMQEAILAVAKTKESDVDLDDAIIVEEEAQTDGEEKPKAHKRLKKQKV